jgi:hypothetical protein
MARRATGDSDGADEAFALAWQLWQAGAASELLPEGRMLDLEGSLRCVVSEAPAALRMFCEAARKKAMTVEMAGRVSGFGRAQGRGWRDWVGLTVSQDHVRQDLSKIGVADYSRAEDFTNGTLGTDSIGRARNSP